MDSKHIILLCGRRTTGKDTSALFIKEYLARHGISSEIKSFADPLKELSIDILGCSRSEMYGPSADRAKLTNIAWSEIDESFHPADKSDATHLSNRDVLTLVGTNVMRAFMPNIWSRAAFISAMNSEASVVIFSDTRFPNEISVFNSLPNVTTIRLYRDSGPLLNHVSDSALDKYDERMEQVRLPSCADISGDSSRYFEVVAQNLWKSLGSTKDVQFDWLLDNNGSIRELEASLKLLCDRDIL